MPRNVDSRRSRHKAFRVLILAKITTSSAGSYADYLEGKSQAPELGDYYLKDGERTEAPGRWAHGADQFGLDGQLPVTAEQLHTLMDVRRPDTGAELRRAGGSGDAVAAIDATFSAPKSVSAAWALAGPDLRAQIEAAHETAIDRALTYATTQVPMLRRRVAQDTVIHEKAHGLIATSWRHTTARAVDQQAPDPQLHSHVLLHGAVRRDGRIVAIDSRAWLVHQREVGAAYRTELAYELTQLGFAVTRHTGRGGRYFELNGVPQRLIDRWSSRHHQVQTAIRQRLTDQHHDLQTAIAHGGPAALDAARQLEALEQTMQLSPAQERMMGTITRSAKAPVTVHDLDRDWHHTARQLGVTQDRIEGLRSHHAQSPAPASRSEVLAGLTEFDATFSARDARAVALERSAGAPIRHALEQLRELRAAQEILVLADGTGTTHQHRGKERTVVAITQRLTQHGLPPLPTTLAQRETERLDHELAASGGRLSEEQRAAITLGCGHQQLVVIQGQAGTGKSTTLTGIARAHHAAGRQILVTSTAAVAAERLATELTTNGVTCQAYSTAALHAAVTHDRVYLTPQTTIIHDEAALASTREQLELLSAVETSGARMIAVGDPQQNQPVGAGGLWNHVEQSTRTAGAHVELTHNQRARHPADRRDQAHFRDGRIERAIRGYAARDHIHLHGDPRRVEDQALAAAHADRSSGLNTMVIAQTSNDQLDALNARAQAIRRQAGQLGGDSIPTPGRPYPLHPGDYVQIRHTIPHPDHGALRNGTSAQITAIDAETKGLMLRFPNTDELWLTAQQAADADLRLAYVQHPFPAQGHTTDTTHLLITDHTTREGAYVGLTRARNTTNIYGTAAPAPEPHDRLQQLAANMSRAEPELPSIQTPLAHKRTLSTARRIDATRPEPTHTTEDAPRPSRPNRGDDTWRRDQHIQEADHSAQIRDRGVEHPLRDPNRERLSTEQDGMRSEPTEQDTDAVLAAGRSIRAWPGVLGAELLAPAQAELRQREQSLEIEP